jgi:hypothetical protein
METVAKKDFDAVEDAILSAYQMNKNSRRRVQVKIDMFKNITLLEIYIGNVKGKDYKYRQRLFRDGVETFSYWLDQEQRCPLIAKMLFEGYSQARTAEMLGFHVGTIHKDVRYMREKTTLLDGYVSRVPKDIVVSKIRRVRGGIPEVTVQRLH